MNRNRPNKRNQQGFTLIELIISMVIISIALSGTILTFQTAGKFSADPMVIQQGMVIAKSYLEEVMSKSFPTAVPCPTPPVAGRSEYATVCDYDGLADSGARDQMNQAITGLGNYSVAVSIDTTSAVLGALTTGSQVVRIDVTVTNPHMPMVTISGYRTAY